MGALSGAVCIFDLDGTLVDSAPDLCAALNRILAEEGLEAMDPAGVRPIVGEGARAMLLHSFERQGRPFPEGEPADALVARYIRTYQERISEHSLPFPGVEACLAELSGHGATLAVCTNKTEALAEPLLRDLGLRGPFAMVVAADTLPERKPSALPLRHIMKVTAADRGIMIGDTKTDLLAAEAAQLPALIANFGYGEGDPSLANADTFADYATLAGLVLSRLG